MSNKLAVIGHKWHAGQSIIEILVAIAVGALLLIAAAAVIAPILRANTQATRLQAAAALANELANNLRVWSEGNWTKILNLATSSANTYYLHATSLAFHDRHGNGKRNGLDHHVFPLLLCR